MTAPARHIEAREPTVSIAGESATVDRRGALFFAAARLLVVSDLHLEKGSSFARRGMLIPPYDSAATLALLAAVIAEHDPAIVVSLGDSFHDGQGAARLPARFAARPGSADGRPAMVLDRRQPRSRHAGRPARRDGARAGLWRAGVPPRAVARRSRPARSPGICIPAPASSSAAVRCAAAALPPTAAA